MHWLDPDHLPESAGVAERFLLNPYGQADGMILTNGREGHFPPHLSDGIRARFVWARWSRSAACGHGPPT
jgi:hypothetical protein